MTVEEYMQAREEDICELMFCIHRHLLAIDGVSTKLSFKIPFYYKNSWICYLNPVKNGGIELCFLHGNKMENPNGLLEMRGRKQVAGIYLHPTEDIPDAVFEVLIPEALRVDELIAKKKKK